MKRLFCGGFAEAGGGGTLDGTVPDVRKGTGGRVCIGIFFLWLVNDGVFSLEDKKGFRCSRSCHCNLPVALLELEPVQVGELQQGWGRGQVPVREAAGTEGA